MLLFAFLNIHYHLFIDGDMLIDIHCFQVKSSCPVGEGPSVWFCTIQFHFISVILILSITTVLHRPSCNPSLLTVSSSFVSPGSFIIDVLSFVPNYKNYAVLIIDCSMSKVRFVQLVVLIIQLLTSFFLRQKLGSEQKTKFCCVLVWC